MKKMFGSLRTQIIILSLAGFIIVQAALFENYYQFRELKIRDNRVRYQELLSQVSLSVETSCSYLNDMLEQIAYSNDVQEYLKNTDTDYRRDHQKQIRSLLDSMSKLRSGIKDIAVVDSDGDCTNLNGNIYQVQELAREIPENSRYYYTGLKSLRFSQAQTAEGFTVGTKVYSTMDFTRDEPIGTVLISFNIPCIFESVNYEGTDSLPIMLVYDRDMNLVLSSGSDEIDLSYSAYFDSDRNQISEDITFGSKTYYIESDSLKMLDGKIVFLISRENLLFGMEELQGRMIIFAVFTVISLTVFSSFVIYRIVHPLNQFMNWMSEINKGDLSLMSKPVKLKGATEIEIMAEQFNGMMRQITELTHNLIDTTSELYESELEKQRAELEYMYSQVNPHFLFNTLESVKGCAMEENAPRTFKMVNSLGKIFKYCIRGDDMVKLSDEVSTADSYMDLQQIRFENRLTYYDRVPESILDTPIPKMILQPLLENAVVHGIEENGASAVWLDGWQLDDCVVLTVTDNGNSIDKEKLEELEGRLGERSQPAHIGISNIYNRLKSIYGEQYGLELMDMEKGFGVRIRIPLEDKRIRGSA